MTRKTDEYLELERRLGHIRWKHRGEDSDEEHELLDSMDDVWWSLSSEEMDYLNSRTLPSSLSNNNDRLGSLRTILLDIPVTEAANRAIYRRDFDRSA